MDKWDFIVGGILLVILGIFITFCAGVFGLYQYLFNPPPLDVNIESADCTEKNWIPIEGTEVDMDLPDNRTLSVKITDDEPYNAHLFVDEQPYDIKHIGVCETYVVKFKDKVIGKIMMNKGLFIKAP